MNNHEKCSCCGEFFETSDGILDVFEENCEYCHDLIEKGKIIYEDCLKSGDFDYSMN